MSDEETSPLPFIETTEPDYAAAVLDPDSDFSWQELSDGDLILRGRCPRCQEAYSKAVEIGPLDGELDAHLSVHISTDLL